MAFDASFYRTTLPERVTRECQARPDEIPVGNLHLANGRVLDLCHIVHLGDTWLAVQYFRDVHTCEEMGLTFLPCGLVTPVTVSLYHPGSRRIGFGPGAKSAGSP